MNTLLDLLRKQTFIVATSVIVLALLVFIIGAMLGVPLIYRIIIIVVIFFGAIILVLYRKMKEAQKAGQIEKDMSSQAAMQMQNLSPEKRAEIEQFKKQLEAAIASLKNSKLGKGKSGKAALYALPWYMVIGPSAAGKTTMIQNSGLEFPFGREGFRGVGGTRNCDWFFSTEAIFLDTAGRYVTQEEDRAEWFAFLSILKKNRKKRPVNGVIAALNIDEIINSGNDQLYEHAKNVKERITELIETLGVNFPVYFMFTKSDLIQGFVEYFGDFSETERAQIWGSSLTAHQQSDPKPKEVFEEEFQKLSDKIFEIRAQKLSSPLKREERKKVFLFPYQFSSLKEKLAYLVGEIFQPNPYQDNPIFRGFYFTSGTQEGFPIDLAIRQIAKQFNLQVGYEKEEDTPREKKHYFIKDLMHKVIIGDQNYKVGHTIGHKKKSSTFRLAVMLVSAAVLLFYAVYTYIGYRNSNEFLEKINRASVTFRNIDWNGDLLNSLSKADSLRRLIVEIEKGESEASFGIFGTNKYEDLLAPLRKLYFSRTEKFFTQNIYNGLVRNLDNYANGQEYPGEKVYNYLKTYLLLGSERSRYDTLEARFLVQVFTDIFQSNYLNMNPYLPAVSKDSLRNLFREHMEYYVTQFKDPSVYLVKNDVLLLSLVRSRIQYKPNAASIYTRLKQYGMSLYPAQYRLDKYIGTTFMSLMSASTTIPFVMTIEGWNAYMKQAIKEETQNPNKEDWVLGKSQVLAAATAVDTENMAKELVNTYVTDVKQTWFQFLEGIKFENFTSVPMAANNIKMIADPGNSPLIVLLQEFCNEMKIVQVIQSDSADPFFSKIKIDDMTVEEINRYVAAVGTGAGKGENLKAVISQCGVISSVLESIKDGQDLTKDYAEKVLNQQAADFSVALQMIKNAGYNLPSLQNLFSGPVVYSWQAILADAAAYINDQWKIKVADVYERTLAGFYPFNSKGQDVPLQDFRDFFKPDGVYWSFFDSELKGFINKERLSINKWGNEGLKFSDEFMSSLKKTGDITSTLFKNGTLGISFKLKPQLPESKAVADKKPIIEQIYLYIDGEEDSYKMGSQFWKDYMWPGSKGTPGTRMNITIRGVGTSETKSYDGEWALFRLLDDGKISSGGSSSQYVFNWFFKKPGSYDVVVTYQLNAGSSRNPFADNFFKTFNLPVKIN